MKYLVTEMRAVTVEADTPAEAEAQALEMMDGLGTTYAIEVEPLTRETRE